MPIDTVSARPGKQIWEAIADDIKDGIISGRYRPLDRLKEADLAARYTVSKTPIREALRHLERMGFVEVIPHTMVVVKQADAREAWSLFAIQSVLEGLAARLAVPKLTPTQLQAMRRHAALAEKHRQEGRIAQAEEANFQFHALLWRASDNEELLEMLEKTHERIQRYRPLTRTHRSQFDHVARGHAEILEALDQRDPERAEQLLRRHVEAYGKVIAGLLRQAE